VFVGEDMDFLYEAAKDYSELLDKDYHITAVYKDEVMSFSITARG